MKRYTVKEVARLSGVTVRTLHFYDEIDLLKPAYYGENGYRYYEKDQLLGLQQILFYRVLQFPLEEIQRLMDDPDCNRQAALEHQRSLLEARATELRSLATLIDKTLADIQLPEEQKMSTKEMFEVFPEINEATLGSSPPSVGRNTARRTGRA